MKRLTLLVASLVLVQTAWSAESAPTNPKLKRKIANTAATEADVKEKAKILATYCGDDAAPTLTKFLRDKDSKENKNTYYIATCPAGAYNMASVLLFDDSYDGLKFIPLASPVTDIRGRQIQGFTADVVVGDLTYDATKGELTNFSKGRGVGDTSSTGIYRFTPSYDTQVVLSKYLLDVTENGKVDPRTIYDSKIKAAK